MCCHQWLHELAFCSSFVPAWMSKRRLHFGAFRWGNAWLRVGLAIACMETADWLILCQRVLASEMELGLDS